MFLESQNLFLLTFLQFSPHVQRLSYFGSAETKQLVEILPLFVHTKNPGDAVFYEAGAHLVSHRARTNKSAIWDGLCSGP